MTAGDYPLKKGKPTSEGIEQYVEENADLLLREYQEFIGDTLYNVWIVNSYENFGSSFIEEGLCE